MPLEPKSAPSSPKIESKRFLLHQKSQDPCLQFPSLSDRVWASLSREQLANEEAECEASLTDNKLADKQSLFRDLVQTQLSLWTFTVSTLLTYFWQKRVHPRSVIFAFVAVGVTFLVSGVLATVVMAAHLFNSDFANSFGGLGEWLSDDEAKYPHLVRRQNSSSFKKTGRRSGTTTPRAGSTEKIHTTRFWQKNVSTLERVYMGSSRA
jgi:hypothetical protein